MSTLSAMFQHQRYSGEKTDKALQVYMLMVIMITDKCITSGSDGDSDNKGGKGLKKDGWASLSKRHVSRGLDYMRKCARPCARG